MPRKLPLSKQLVRRDESAPFFGRIVSADVSCPRCDWTTRIGRVGGKKRKFDQAVTRRGERRTWNPRTMRFKCQRCGLVLRLGLLAHRVIARGGSPAAPEGTVPTYAQALSLRRELSRIRWEREGVAAPNNAWAEQATPALEDDERDERGVPAEKGVQESQDPAAEAQTLWADLFRLAGRVVEFHQAEEGDIPSEVNELQRIIWRIEQARLR